MPSIDRSAIPKIGVGLINANNTSGGMNKPKINKPIMNPLIKSNILRKDSDHQMAEP